LHLELAPEALTQLQHDLWQLMEKYTALNKIGVSRKPCTVHLGFVERE
jgi:hypothetical protein